MKKRTHPEFGASSFGDPFALVDSVLAGLAGVAVYSIGTPIAAMASCFFFALAMFFMAFVSRKTVVFSFHVGNAFVFGYLFIKGCLLAQDNLPNGSTLAVWGGLILAGTAAYAFVRAVKCVKEALDDDDGDD